MTRELFGINDAEWMNHGKCAGRPEQDTPKSRRIYGEDVDTSWHPDGAQREAFAARTACSGCPVVNQCLQYALDHPEEEGIWGGTTMAQRAALRGEIGAA